MQPSPDFTPKTFLYSNDFLSIVEKMTTLSRLYLGSIRQDSCPQIRGRFVDDKHLFSFFFIFLPTIVAKPIVYTRAIQNPKNKIISDKKVTPFKTTKSGNSRPECNSFLKNACPASLIVSILY